jgi:hypothetical protein
VDKLRATALRYASCGHREAVGRSDQVAESGGNPAGLQYANPRLIVSFIH